MQFKNYDKVLIQPKLEKMSSEEVLRISPLIGKSKSYDFVKMNNEIYHLKHKLIHFLLNELIGEIISEYFELQTKKSLIIMNEDNFNNSTSIFPVPQFSLLAKSFFETDLEYCRFNEFSTYYGADGSLKNLNGIGRFFNVITGTDEKICNEDLIKLIYDLKKMIIRDFLTKQSDRSIANFIFGYKGNHIKLMPLYDYEHSFKSTILLYRNVFEINLNSTHTVNILKHDKCFQELLYKLMNFNFDFVLTKLEEDYSIILNREEYGNYVDVIQEQQRFIRERNLLK